MLSDLLGSTRYAATMKCLTNDSLIASLYVIADVIIVTCLLACGAKLWTKRRAGYFFYPFQANLIAICVVLIALGHLMEIITLFDGAYRLEILLRGAAAGVSVIVAYSCWSRP